ncbi:MAG: phosphoribosylformylglycinamidine synthase subunit PurL [Thermoplasmata archaeon]
MRRPSRSTPAWSQRVSTIPLMSRRRKELEEDPTIRGFGFDASEIAALHRHFVGQDRDPTDVEIAGIAQSWSEHCSYKSSRPILKRGFRGLRTRGVEGTGDAGVMRFEPGWAYALRIESHNHPSAIEPYGGAATGIGGILRDVLAVGARPIALADPLFFGPLSTPADSLPFGVHSPRYVANGVVAGIRDYGNRVGVPTVCGGVFFDPSYTVNPLVNVACVGILPRRRLAPNRARKAGDLLVLAGGHTGRDGIGGVSFASQELTSVSGSESRGAVQLGNPILKEPLIRACIEAYDRRLIAGVKDLGGGGLASGAGELAFAGGLGVRLDLDRVPLRETGLLPWEIWISESQERMVFDVRPRDLSALEGIFQRYDVPAVVLGEFTREPFETIECSGELAAHLRLSFRIRPPPVRRRSRRPTPARRNSPRVEAHLGKLVEELLLAPDSVSRESILRVYDHEVQGRTVIKPLQGRVNSPSHGDAAVLQPRRESWRGLALTVATQPWACSEDPHRGGVWVVEEAARNLYAVGARPDAISDCLNFGNPEDPGVLGSLNEVVAGLAEGARALDLAIPSGNVSLYNGGLGHAVLPTPVLLATGIVKDLRQSVTTDLKVAGSPLYLVGRTHPELGGSLWARRRSLRGLRIPPTDPARVRTLGERLLRGASRGWLRSMHDVADGGLAVALPEMAFGGGLGFSVDLAKVGLETPAHALAAEGMSRWVVEVDADRVTEFDRAFEGLPCAHLGTVAKGPGRWLWRGRELSRLDLTRLYARWRAGLGV